MLNASQKQATQITEGPLEIIAGAGTGKTQALVSRITELINSNKAQPDEILVLTFTNKAAHELNDRLRKDSKAVRATTFHGLAAGVLRKFWKQNFSIISVAQQEEMVRDILYSQERDELTAMVNDLNNVRMSAACKASWPILQANTKITRLGEIWQAYNRALEARGAVDFTGILTTLFSLWTEDADLLQQCQDQFRYVMVDEYQDINPIQSAIVQKLVESHRNICVVGDPDQVIYSWRGARINTMDFFKDLYPDAQIVTLTQNHRNPATILKGADNLISHAEHRTPRTLEPTIGGEQPIMLWESTDEWQQNEMLFHLLDQYIAGDEERSFGDIAILYRTHAQGRMIAAHLDKKNYPFQRAAMPHFWENKDLKRLIEKLTAVQKLAILPKEEIIFSDWFRTQIEEFIWHQSIPEKKAKLLLQLLPHAKAFDHYPLMEAVNHFLDEANTAQDADNVFNSGRINLMTLHAAKGLEFPVVLIVGLEEGYLPHKDMKDDPYWLAEERRLLYVGMTRATKQLHLFTSRKMDSNLLEPSRFLGEIGAESLSYGRLPERGTINTELTQMRKDQMKMF
jgi:DNA helicase II / ATP-dependent DNA helicase PcrA